VSSRFRLSLTVLVLAVAAMLLAGGGVPGIAGGASLFIVLHDGNYDDAAFSDMATEIQDSSHAVAKEIAAAGWKSWVLDDETLDGNKQPFPLLVKLGVYDSIKDGKRELLSVSPPDKLIAREPLPPDATAETVLALMKARGKR
jgi:hypothetical protein